MSDAEAAAAAGTGGAALKKGPWTAAEDEILLEYVRKHGEGNWNAVQKNTGLQRCGKSCRLRWSNHLRPNLKKGSFSAEEELLILRLHAQLGNKWARMAAHLPGRTDNEIKNYWNTRIKRRQRAGLPIYPPDIHCHHQHHHHHHRASSSPINTPPLTPTSTDQKSHPFSLMSSSCMNPNSTMPFMAPNHSVLQLPGMKHLTFPHSPLSPHTPQLHPQYQQHRPPIQFSSGNFNFNLNQMNYQPLFVKTELPSAQIVSGDAAGGDLLDAMLMEAQCLCGESSSMQEQGLRWSQLGNRSTNGVQGYTTNDELRTKAKPEAADLTSATAPTLSPATPLVLPDWYNNSPSSNEMSNGAQLTDDDDIRLEMQQLASSLSMAPVSASWNTTTEPYSGWDNMPGICS